MRKRSSRNSACSLRVLDPPYPTCKFPMMSCRSHRLHLPPTPSALPLGFPTDDRAAGMILSIHMKVSLVSPSSARRISARIKSSLRHARLWCSGICLQFVGRRSSPPPLPPEPVGIGLVRKRSDRLYLSIMLPSCTLFGASAAEARLRLEPTSRGRPFSFPGKAERE